MTGVSCGLDEIHAGLGTIASGLCESPDDVSSTELSENATDSSVRSDSISDVSLNRGLMNSNTMSTSRFCSILRNFLDSRLDSLSGNIMSLVCAISGYPPEEPVLSRDGYIFEKRLIESVISETGMCPVTNAPLSADDLRPVLGTSNNKSVPVDSSSLPGLIQMFGKEWDRLMVDSYTIKAQLAAVQEELAKALYEQEASNRLVARLSRERDEALAEISRLQEEQGQLHYSSEQ